jgi:hypothetical protein
MRNSRTSKRTRSVVVAAIAIGLTVIAGQAFAAETTQPFAAVRPLAPLSASVASLQPPAGMIVVSVHQVTSGVQKYTCSAGSWAFKAPEATMVAVFGSPRSIHHFGGPTWQSIDDGSSVVAAKQAESPVPGAVPQLLLKATRHGGSGALSKVTFVQRLATSGGQAPPNPCAAGATADVPYRATYTFWAPV